jgi:ADP-ribose pyrophosphatase YjhB (NUDIX family)
MSPLFYNIELGGIEMSVKGCGVIVLKHATKVLFGKRTDNQGWSLAGGKLEKNETTDIAAYRELDEEFSLSAVDLVKVGSIKSKAKVRGVVSDTESDIFLCEEWVGTPRPQLEEMSQLIWLTREEYENTQETIFPPSKEALKLIGWFKKEVI